MGEKQATMQSDCQAATRSYTRDGTACTEHGRGMRVKLIERSCGGLVTAGWEVARGKQRSSSDDAAAVS